MPNIRPKKKLLIIIFDVDQSFVELVNTTGNFVQELPDNGL